MLSEDLIDIGNQSGYDPTTGQVIDLSTSQPDAEIGAVADGLIVEDEDGNEIEVSGAELLDYVGAKKKKKTGLLARVRENREERQEDRQDRREDRREDRQDRREDRQERRNGDDDSGGYWEQYSYNFTTTNSGGSTASVTSAKSIGSRFIAEKISLQGSAGGSLFRSLKVGDDYVLDYPDGAAVENFAVNGYMLNAIEGREFPANSTATLVIDNVPASGLVRALVSGRRWRTKPRCN